MVIYLNNAAGSYPKPDCVLSAMTQALTDPPANPYRQSSAEADAGSICRARLSKLFNTDAPERILLCSGSTEALNIAIFGLAQDGTHAITTRMEHNSALRPLFLLRDTGKIRLSILEGDPRGGIGPEDLEKALEKDTRLIVVNHASNVTGHIQPMKDLYHLAQRHRIPLVLDVSQSAGAIGIDLSGMDDAVVAFTGHKSLLGPPGTGGLVVGKNIDLKFWKVGGTGIRSDLETMPDLWPLKYEPGTPNHPGIAGLAAALGFLLEAGNCLKKGDLVDHAWQELKKLKGIRLYSERPEENPCGVFAFNLDGWRCKDLGYLLAESFNIQVRTGLHCAPLIHQSMGTFPEGTARASLSSFNTHDEIETFGKAMRQIAGNA